MQYMTEGIITLEVLDKSARLFMPKKMRMYVTKIHWVLFVAAVIEIVSGILAGGIIAYIAAAILVVAGFITKFVIVPRIEKKFCDAVKARFLESAPSGRVKTRCVFGENGIQVLRTDMKGVKVEVPYSEVESFEEVDQNMLFVGFDKEENAFFAFTDKLSPEDLGALVNLISSKGVKVKRLR